MSKLVRNERDSMGLVPVPARAYYGASTQRAVENFPISAVRLQRSFVKALALIKHCAAEINFRHAKLDKQVATAIKRASLEVANGRFDDHFVVDVFQTGSGTSTNMNANEVIANRAIELLGGKRGDRSLVHPNDHVNLGMSSNDAIPSATHLAALMDIDATLVPALQALELSLSAKSHQFAAVIKTGRTHLQDATPITLGQEFSGYAAQVGNCLSAVEDGRKRLLALALGGTAVGTGVNTRADYAAGVLALLCRKTGIPVYETANHFQAQGTLDAVVMMSGALRATAVSLKKIADDIRLLACGPRAGFAEINLPEVQPGSSIMPGKVNPVIIESLCMASVQVMGLDAAIAIAGQSGTLELNVMQPLAAYNLLLSIELLANSANNFRLRCLDGITATNRGPESVEQGLALCTALVPAIGYDASAAIAKEAAATGKSVREVARTKTTMSEEELAQRLEPMKMTHPDPAPAAPPVKSKGKRKRSLILGLTGGIACGKSAVGKMLVELGAAVIDTDVLGHELQVGPNPTYRKLLRRFGADIVDTPGGPINRKKLGAKVFGNPAELAALNAIMHPAIRRLMHKRIKENKAAEAVVVQVPLLFESRMEHEFDEIWAIIVDAAIQKQRLMDRNGYSAEEAQKRIDAQMPQAEKARRSRCVIDNSGTLVATRRQVSEFYVDALRRFRER